MQTYETRWQRKSSKNRERLKRWRHRKQVLHTERTKDEPIRGEWRGRFAFTITYQNRMASDFHAFDFYLSDKRVNSYRVERDGQPWKKQISLTRALAGLRKAIPKLTLHT